MRRPAPRRGVRYSCCAGDGPGLGSRMRRSPPDQRPADRPAFSLSSGEIFTSKQLALRHADLRAPRLARLPDLPRRRSRRLLRRPDDAHTLGSEAYTVPTEQTWLERLASWKADRRADLQSFLRQQTSHDTAQQRRDGADKATVQRRVQLGLKAYAQVPLLNDKQVVASWREILPRLADTDVRRIPIEVTSRVSTSSRPSTDATRLHHPHGRPTSRWSPRSHRARCSPTSSIA